MIKSNMNYSKEQASSQKSQHLMIMIGLLQMKMLMFCFGDGFWFVLVR